MITGSDDAPIMPSTTTAVTTSMSVTPRRDNVAFVAFVLMDGVRNCLVWCCMECQSEPKRLSTIIIYRAAITADTAIDNGGPLALGAAIVTVIIRNVLRSGSASTTPLGPTMPPIFTVYVKPMVVKP